MGLIRCVSLYRVTGSFCPVWIGRFFPVLTGSFLPVWIGSECPRFEVQLVDIRLPLPPSLDGQKAVSLKRLEVRTNAPLRQSEVYGEAFLARKTEVILPSIAEQHGEGHLVPGTQFLGFEKEIGNLREALGGRGIRTFEDDVSFFQDVGDVLHMHHYTFTTRP